MHWSLYSTSSISTVALVSSYLAYADRRQKAQLVPHDILLHSLQLTSSIEGRLVLPFLFEGQLFTANKYCPVLTSVVVASTTVLVLLLPALLY